MKKIIALLLALVMVLSMSACGKKTPSTDKPESPDATTPTAEVVEDDAFTHTFTQFGNARIKIVGSEFTRSDWDEDVLRIYYEYTNTDDTANGHHPSTALDFLSITQDGNECETYRFRSGDEMAVPEDTNDENYVQPGCTNRNTILVKCDPNGGVVKVSCYVMIGGWAYNVNDIQPFDFEIDPDNLMGAPEPFVLPAITNPTYTSGMSASVKYDYPLDCEISIDGIELTKDYDGKDVLRVNLTVTNNGEEELTPALMCLLELYQDGVSLPWVNATWDMDSDMATDGDIAYEEDLYPGETVECSALFYPRNTNPVEAVIENVNADLCLGTRFDVKDLFGAADAQATTADATEAAARNALVGTWLERDSDWHNTYIFNADGSGMLTSGFEYPFTYTVDGDILTMKYDDDYEDEFTISIDGNLMTLVDMWGEELLLDKQDAAAPAPTEEPAATEAPEEDPYAYLVTDIIGYWLDVEADENESFTFKADGTGLYTYLDESYTFQYTLEEDLLKIFFEDGDYSSFWASIEDDVLYLSNWALERQS